jgi:hypothetical protein
MKPNRVVETGSHIGVNVFGSHLEARATDRVHDLRRVCGEIIAGKGVTQNVDERIVAQVGHPDPGASQVLFIGNGSPFEKGRPVGRLEIIRPGNARRKRDGGCVGGIFLDLERGREVENRPARLAGDDSTSDEGSAVANTVNFEADRLIEISAADEVGVE